MKAPYTWEGEMASTKPKQKMPPRAKTPRGSEALVHKQPSTPQTGDRTVDALPAPVVAPTIGAKSTRAEDAPVERVSASLVAEVRAGLGVTREFFARLT